MRDEHNMPVNHLYVSSNPAGTLNPCKSTTRFPMETANIRLSAFFAQNGTSTFLSLANSVIKGTIPHNPESSHANVTVKAYDHTTHASSQVSLLITFRQPNKDVTSFAALSQRRRLVLGLSISLGGLAGLVLLAGMMAQKKVENSTRSRAAAA